MLYATQYSGSIICRELRPGAATGDLSAVNAVAAMRYDADDSGSARHTQAGIYCGGLRWAVAPEGVRHAAELADGAAGLADGAAELAGGAGLPARAGPGRVRGRGRPLPRQCLPRPGFAPGLPHLAHELGLAAGGQAAAAGSQPTACGTAGRAARAARPRGNR